MKDEQQKKKELTERNKKLTKDELEDKDVNKIVQEILASMFSNVELNRQSTIGYMYGTICEKKDYDMIKQLYKFNTVMNLCTNNRIAERPELENKIMKKIMDVVYDIDQIASEIIVQYILSLTKDEL